jgi:exocyst complex component 3
MRTRFWFKNHYKLEFIYDDLILVKGEIDPLFPSNYCILVKDEIDPLLPSILSYFVSKYHQNVHKYIEEILQTELNAGTILRLIRWVRHYYTFMEKKIMFRSNFQEWKTNLMERDIREFTQRQNRPEFDSKNLAGLPGAPILISMVSQQIDLATESINYQLLNNVINECYEVMLEVQQAWINLLKSELQRHLDNQEESADGLIIYVVALANDQLGFTDFIDMLSRQFASSLPEEYVKNITNVLNNIMNGSLNVATNAINVILDIIYNDLKKPFRELHTARWYKGNTMAVIVETLKDYTEECHSHLKHDIFDKLMIAMLNRFVIAFIESMRNKAVKFRMPHCIDKMRQDIRLISEFFVQYIGDKELNSQLDVIDKLLNFLGTSQELVYLDYYSLRKAYGDIPRKYLKIILSKRDDLSFIAVKKINKTLKVKAAEAGEYDGEPTVFSKIIIKDLEGASGDELKGDMQEAFHRIRSLRLNKY